MKSRFIYLWLIIVFMITFCIRAYLNFSSGLQIGNGGYYPLQVKTILERGELAFNDMPFLFWMNAFLVKIITSITDFDMKETILFVVKIVDSLSTALITIPLYQILKKYPLTKTASILLPLFVTLSFFTLSLTGSFQKNSLGFLWLFCCLNSTIQSNFFRIRNKHFYLAFVFLVLTGITHFGSFSFGLLFLFTAGIIHFKKSAVLPLIIVGSSSMLVILLFDEVRFYRLVGISKFFADRSAPIFIYLIFALILVIIFFTYRFVKRRRAYFEPRHLTLIHTSLLVILIICCPLFSIEYTHRLFAFILIPLTVIILNIESYLGSISRAITFSSIVLITIGSVTFKTFLPEDKSVTNEELKDLTTMREHISEEGIVICKHNLEFWVAWSTNANVCQVTREDDDLSTRYSDIYLLTQKRAMRGPGGRYGGPGGHFSNPTIPNNALIIYSSEYFDLFKIPREG